MDKTSKKCNFGDFLKFWTKSFSVIVLSRRYLSYCSLKVDETPQLDRIHTKAVPRKVIFEILEKNVILAIF